MASENFLKGIKNIKLTSFQEYLLLKLAANKGPFLATDTIIEYNDGGREGVVLIERKYPPYGIAIPGGIAERMVLKENCRKESREETGLEVEIYDAMPILSDDLNQDPRAFIVSVAYVGRGRGKLKPHPEEDARSARIYTLEELGELAKHEDAWAFSHHRKIIQKYLKYREDGHYQRRSSLECIAK